jgi:hypothetical protein
MIILFAEQIGEFSQAMSAETEILRHFISGVGKRS